jgi:DNA-binding XRE family transcriptional regulator
MVIMQHADISNQTISKGEKMRRKYNPQLSLFTTPSNNPIA